MNEIEICPQRCACGCLAQILKTIEGSPRSHAQQPAGYIDFPYQQTFDAIVAATSLWPTKAEPSGISVSVQKFVETFNAAAPRSPAECAPVTETDVILETINDRSPRVREAIDRMLYKFDVRPRASTTPHVSQPE